MFGCVVAGRQIQTNMQQVEPGKFVFILSEPTKINHLTVFTTDPFEPGYGASLYYNTAKQQAMGGPWQFLGILSNDKPSAIFRVKQQSNDDMQMDSNDDNDYGELGISIEPLAVLESLSQQKALVLAEKNSNSTNSDAPLTIQKITENAFNYLSSYVKPAYSFGSEHVVPLKALEDWYNNCIRKAALDPQWLSK